MSCVLRDTETDLCCLKMIPDSKDCVANMGPTWVLAAPGEPHVSPTNPAIRDAQCAWRIMYTICVL